MNIAAVYNIYYMLVNINTNYTPLLNSTNQLPIVCYEKNKFTHNLEININPCFIDIMGNGVEYNDMKTYVDTTINNNVR